MNKDEEYVRSVWVNVATNRDEFIGFIFFTDNALYGEVCAPTMPELWAKGAEYTRERLEQVRQLREEIRFVCEADYSGSDGEVTEQAEAAQKRTIGRLESALATLTQGVKPEALQ